MSCSTFQSPHGVGLSNCSGRTPRAIADVAFAACSRVISMSIRVWLDRLCSDDVLVGESEIEFHSVQRKSQLSACPRGCPQLLPVAQRGCAEDTLVLPVEVGRAVVPH